MAMAMRAVSHSIGGRPPPCISHSRTLVPVGDNGRRFSAILSSDSSPAERSRKKTPWWQWTKYSLALPT
eukprot:1677974-Amphidinium_carterae.1